MIVSASYRTDIPAFYGAWFAARLEAGYCMVANPYGGKPYRVPLKEGVDGFVFWTRNIRPFLPVLDIVAGSGLPFVVHYTLTGYPSLLEPKTPAPAHAVAAMQDLAGRYGPDAVVWRYDPILFSAPTPPSWHLANFAALARALEGAVNEVMTSFAQPYAKTRRNMRRAGPELDWVAKPEAALRRDLRHGLEEIARARGMRLALCCQPDEEGAARAACIDPDRLSRVAGHAVSARRRPNRPGCGCAVSRDIGAYDSCVQGCLYCYAVAGPEKALLNRGRHDPAADMLIV